VKKRFEIIYDERVATRLAVIDRKHYSFIKQTIEKRLTYQPDVETRNRKPLQKPSALGDAWELRFGPDNRFRVFYKFDLENRQVFILAIGVKEGNRLLIGREVFTL
jgi:mRNA-degrading endonuclease RelE of RelBE toxin-antitoxin system